ncbi:MAG: hypothetical protein Q7U16_14485 [Agitococcus sp.]|nr:hypothetical protein [Agitococcus sp.]
MDTSISIAKSTKINQSQIYRNLFMEPRKISQTLRKLCNISGITMHTERPDPRKSELLMNAIGAVWDGSEEHAKRLATMIFAVKQANVR